MFTFRNERDSEAFVQDAKLEGLKAEPKDDPWWKGRVNNHELWMRKDKEMSTQELVIELAVERSQPTYRGMRRESVKRGVASDPFEVVIPADSKKPLQQTKRLTRRSLVLSNPDVPEKVGRFQEVEKSEKVKRRRGSLTDEAARYEKQPLTINSSYHALTQTLGNLGPPKSASWSSLNRNGFPPFYIPLKVPKDRWWSMKIWLGLALRSSLTTTSSIST